MDFGPNGTRFWHTWHPRGPEEWNTPEFKAELGEVVDSLRQNVLQGLSAMRSYCREHGGEISGGWAQNYGYIVETERYRYCLRCNPIPGDYQAYLTCYDKQVQEMKLCDVATFPGGWHKGDTCFLITNKAKKYALEHTVESFDGTYFGVRGHTGLFHHVSPQRMFRSKEEAIASLISTPKILNAFPHLARCAEKADPETQAEAAEAIAKAIGGDSEQMSRFQAAMAYCDCIDLPEAVAVAEHLDCFEFIPIAEFKEKAKDELLGLGLDKRVIDQCIDFSQYAAIKHGWGDLFCAQDAGQYIRQSNPSFVLAECTHPQSGMTMGGGMCGI